MALMESSAIDGVAEAINRLSHAQRVLAKVELAKLLKINLKTVDSIKKVNDLYRQL